ncbi:hypothetical protein [Aeromicrobium terrae]|uniref:Uncharacterized protein n=1 Tax=Aeromicrobium terrae TaxID=2498846 RepID=A0A5C8NIA3_9ACTN|nr:hypothetical protein [Aeromicrobium terrae]TXL60912.1 hypothetical protein FHP06_10860 [Aeromicrobium terrae]
MTRLPPHPAKDGKVLDANVHLLDRLVVDRNDEPVSVVSDLELESEDGGRPRIANLVLGSAIVSRFLGGHPPKHHLDRMAWRKVAALDTVVHLRVDRSELDVIWFERWLRRHVIGRIPGGRRDPE